MTSYRAQTGLGLGGPNLTHPGLSTAPVAVHAGGLVPQDFVDDPANVNTVRALLDSGAIAVADGPEDGYGSNDEVASDDPHPRR